MHVVVRCLYNLTHKQCGMSRLQTAGVMFSGLACAAQVKFALHALFRILNACLALTLSEKVLKEDKGWVAAQPAARATKTLIVVKKVHYFPKIAVWASRWETPSEKASEGALAMPLARR